jgi:hypothetical protein
MTPKNVVYDKHHVLCSREHLGERLDVIQETVVPSVYNEFIHFSGELVVVHDHPSAEIDIPGDPDREGIVVTMLTRALVEDLTVLFFVPVVSP